MVRGDPSSTYKYGRLARLAEGRTLEREVRARCGSEDVEMLLVELLGTPTGSISIEGFDVVQDVGGEERVLRVDTGYFLCDGRLGSPECDADAEAFWDPS
ncbi:hypothetical protein [Aeromicrobium sp. IC_218]|uniref:hypothetical protein n=1 Tax=Aeromicrobium sp. IC_218 TaxID=2545468 RepID=UPI0013F430C3|nr:hypothetical protein [Aeromicrobium sp. IC_218]